MKALAIFPVFVLTIIYASAQPAAPQKLKDLDFLVGKWKVNADIRLSAQGPWEKSVATSVIRKTLSDALIEEEFSGTRENKPLLIKSIFAMNNMNNKYQRVFADSEHGVLIDFEGSKLNDTLYFDKTWTYTNGSTVQLRVAYYVKSQDKFELVSMRMPQQATDWDITGRMTYTRVE